MCVCVVDSSAHKQVFLDFTLTFISSNKGALTFLAFIPRVDRLQSQLKHLNVAENLIWTESSLKS